jgi:carboxypeptidase PM20D1
MIRTTTAPTMLRGGIKDNVLPTRASAKVNFRILPGETKETVIEYVRKTIDDKRVIISISNPEGAFDPSPVASTSNFGFEVLQKTILEVFPEVAVAPGLFIGFTDSRHFIGLSDDIYRFAPLQLNQSELSSLHGINEKISVANYKKLIHFYQQLIQNSCK